MTSSQAQAVQQVPPRTVPIPAHLSAEAQAVLGLGMIGAVDYPELDDTDAWREMASVYEREYFAAMEPVVSSANASVERMDVEDVPVFVATPDGLSTKDHRVFLDIHGGGLFMGGGECCRLTSLLAVGRSRVRTWAVDYRMPPDNPYPAPLDDCVSVYRAILEDHRPEDVMVAGTSAGGNLAAALILRARDEGLPLPTAALFFSPEADLTESGDSFQTNLGLDNVLTKSLMPANQLYSAGHDLADPFLSPLFGDYTKGFPPAMLTSGTRDLFLSNAVRLHRVLRAADVPAELHILEAAGHGGFFGHTPEDKEMESEIRRFIDAHWSN
jgi:epsilon-lactone hydrolase